MYHGGTETGGESDTHIRDPTYQEPVLRNAKDFEASIREKKPLNNAAESPQSTLTGILGRTAAYEGRVVTWNEMMASDTRIDRSS